MLREVIFIALISVITVPEVESRSTHMARNYVRNMEKSIAANCNYRAFLATNNTEVYECFKNKNSNCCNLVNFTEFNTIRNNCIGEYHAEFGKGVLISIAIWGLIFCLGAIKPH